MYRSHGVLIAASGLALAACMSSTTQAETDADRTLPGVCNADAAQRLVGGMRAPALGEEALRLSGASEIRWIAPGQPVTMDYRTDRLNIEHDANGRVTVIRCG